MAISGSGTQADPYIVSDWDNLIAKIAINVNKSIKKPHPFPGKKILFMH